MFGFAMQWCECMKEMIVKCIVVSFRSQSVTTSKLFERHEEIGKKPGDAKT